MNLTPALCAYRKAVAVLILSWLATAVVASDTADKRVKNPRGYETDIFSETFGFTQQDIDADLDQVYQGCAQRDCIPSIEQPEFVPASEVNFLDDDDLVMVVSIGGKNRAYPTRILDRHEIVNDRFGEMPVAVTFCPLCGSGVAFVRVIDGETVEFGVSGLLHANDLVMYDRKSNSLWQQVTGEALAGPQRGAELETVPSSMTLFGLWRDAHPEGRVLALPEESERYIKSVYADYIGSDRLLFPVSKTDARLHAKRVIYGVELDGQVIAVDSEWLESESSWEKNLGDRLLKLEFSPANGVIGSLDGDAVTVHRMFWFAWYSFHPDTALIYEKNH